MKQMTEHYQGDKPEKIAEYFLVVFQGKEKLAANGVLPEVVSLLSALCFQNIYNDDMEKNQEILQDLVQASSELNQGEKPRKKLKADGKTFTDPR